MLVPAWKLWDSIIIGSGNERYAGYSLKIIGLIGSAFVLALVGRAAALTIELPGEVMAEERRGEAPGSYALPVGPFDGNTVPVRVKEGAVDQRAYRLDTAGMTTLALLEPMRGQLLREGFKIVLDCDARACGGFDFRYGTEVMPEPDMHVDLGDYRFLSAEKDSEAVSILVSRSVLSGFVQVTRVGTMPLPDAVFRPPQTSASAPEIALRGAATEDPLPPPGDLGAMLDRNGAVALDDLVFPSGAASLANGDYASITALAAWLAANPDKTVALVGHTDASGSLAANIALSERRADLVRKVLIDRYGVEAVRLTSEGVGYLAPRATNQTKEGREKNRRVEAIVTSTR